MGTMWLKIKVWTKLILGILLGLYALAFIWNNSGNPVKFWYWIGRQWDTSQLVLVFFSFAAGVAVALLTRTILGGLRQYRQMREKSRQNKVLSDMQKAAKLNVKSSASSSSPPAAPRTVSPPPADDAAADQGNWRE